MWKRYLGYVLIGLMFIAGYMSLRVQIVLICAALSSFLFMSDRREQVNSQTTFQKPNWILDGIYLFVIQFLILFSVYALGWFLANKVATGG